jgi:hypothetical protein
MKFLLRNSNFILIILLIAALIPYLVICFYALPFADDFCYAWAATEKVSLVKKVLKQYSEWNGRYTSDTLVMLTPLASGSLLNYHLALVVCLSSGVIVVLFSIRTFIHEWLSSMAITLFVSVFYLCYQPNVTEGIYWYTGSVSWHLCNVVLISHLALLLHSFSKQGLIKSVMTLCAGLLLFIGIGFNEIAAALAPSFYLFAVIVCYRSNTAHFKTVLSFFIIAVIASLLVFFSPGNMVRSAEFPNRYQLFHSLLFSLLQTGRFIITWASSVPFIGLSLLMVINAPKFQNTFLAKFDYRIILLLLLFTVFAGAFMPYFGTGILGQHRTINFVFFWFIFLCLWLVVSVSGNLSFVQKFAISAAEKQISVFLIACVVIMIFTGNGGKIVADVCQNKFTLYHEDFLARQKEVIANPTKPVASLKNVPSVFQIVDAKPDNTWWVNNCIKKYYLESGIEPK